MTGITSIDPNSDHEAHEAQRTRGAAMPSGTPLPGRRVSITRDAFEGPEVNAAIATAVSPRKRRIRFSAAALLVGIGPLAAPAGSGASGERSGFGPPRVSFKEFKVPTTHAWPFSITVGPDGNLWFTENSTHRIGRITPTGKITEFQDPGPSAVHTPDGPGNPGDIATGPDGNLWFTADNPDYIGRITPAGQITDFLWGDANDVSNVNGIAAGPDGNMWFTTSMDIGRITPSGTITLFAAPHHLIPQGIAKGRDGNLWFAAVKPQMGTYHFMARITPSGQFTSFRIPIVGTLPQRVVLGPGGNIWFTEHGKIGRITPAGRISQFPTSIPGSEPSGLTMGTDGNLWLADLGTNSIDRMTPSGNVTEFKVPTRNSLPNRIVRGPAHNDLWFTESSSGKIGRVEYAYPTK